MTTMSPLDRQQIRKDIPDMVDKGMNLGQVALVSGTLFILGVLLIKFFLS